MRACLRHVAASSLLVGLLSACGGDAASYERAARDVAAAQGASDLTVSDSVSNVPLDSGRTVRFAVAGDPIAVVPLHMTAPGVCRSGDCAAELAQARTYADGQSAYARSIADAFAPCGFDSINEVVLQGAGSDPARQFVSVVMVLDLPVLAGAEAGAEAGAGAEARAESDARARVAACAERLADIRPGPEPAGAAADWAARPASLVVYLGDLAGEADYPTPLLAGWADAWGGRSAGATHVVEVGIDRGRVTVGPLGPA